MFKKKKYLIILCMLLLSLFAVQNVYALEDYQNSDFFSWSNNVELEPLTNDWKDETYIYDITGDGMPDYSTYAGSSSMDKRVMVYDLVIPISAIYTDGITDINFVYVNVTASTSVCTGNVSVQFMGVNISFYEWVSSSINISLNVSSIMEYWSNLSIYGKWNLSVVFYAHTPTDRPNIRVYNCNYFVIYSYPETLEDLPSFGKGDNDGGWHLTGFGNDTLQCYDLYFNISGTDYDYNTTTGSIAISRFLFTWNVASQVYELKYDSSYINKYQGFWFWAYVDNINLSDRHFNAGGGGGGGDVDESMANSSIVNLTLNNESWVNVNWSSWFNDSAVDTLETILSIDSQYINNSVGGGDVDESMDNETIFNFTDGVFWFNFTVHSWFNDSAVDTLEMIYSNNSHSVCTGGSCSGIVWVNFSDANLSFNVSVDKSDDSNTSEYYIKEDNWLWIAGFSFENGTLSIILTLMLFFFFFGQGYNSKKRSGGMFLIFSGFLFIGLEILISSYLNALYVVPLLTPIAVFCILIGVRKWLYTPSDEKTKSEGQ